MPNMTRSKVGPCRKAIILAYPLRLFFSISDIELSFPFSLDILRYSTRPKSGSSSSQSSLLSTRFACNPCDCLAHRLQNPDGLLFAYVSTQGFPPFPKYSLVFSPFYLPAVYAVLLHLILYSLVEMIIDSIIRLFFLSAISCNLQKERLKEFEEQRMNIAEKKKGAQGAKKNSLINENERIIMIS